MVYRARADSTCSERIRAGRHDSRRPRKPTLLSWRLVRPYHHGTSFSRLRRAVRAPTPVLRYCAGTFERESGYPSCHHLIRDFIPTGWASLFSTRYILSSRRYSRSMRFLFSTWMEWIGWISSNGFCFLCRFI